MPDEKIYLQEMDLFAFAVLSCQERSATENVSLILKHFDALVQWHPLPPPPPPPVPHPLAPHFFSKPHTATFPSLSPLVLQRSVPTVVAVVVVLGGGGGGGGSSNGGGGVFVRFCSCLFLCLFICLSVSFFALFCFCFCFTTLPPHNPLVHVLVPLFLGFTTLWPHSCLFLRFCPPSPPPPPPPPFFFFFFSLHGFSFTSPWFNDASSHSSLRSQCFGQSMFWYQASLVPRVGLLLFFCFVLYFSSFFCFVFCFGYHKNLYTQWVFFFFLFLSLSLCMSFFLSRK